MRARDRKIRSELRFCEDTLLRNATNVLCDQEIMVRGDQKNTGTATEKNPRLEGAPTPEVG